MNELLEKFTSKKTSEYREYIRLKLEKRIKNKKYLIIVCKYSIFENIKF